MAWASVPDCPDWPACAGIGLTTTMREPIVYPAKGVWATGCCRGSEFHEDSVLPWTPHPPATPFISTVSVAASASPVPL